MNPDHLPILYVKAGDSACQEIAAALDGYGVDHREVDVTGNPTFLAELKHKCGREVTPALDWHGEVLVDFGVGELREFLHQHDVVLEDS